MADSENQCAEPPTNTRSPRHLEGESGRDDPNDNDSGDTVSRKEILKALEAVERDSAAIADSFSSLFASLRLSLSQATSSTAEHMSCFSDAAGRLQETGNCESQATLFLVFEYGFERHRYRKLGLELECLNIPSVFGLNQICGVSEGTNEYTNSESKGSFDECLIC